MSIVIYDNSTYNPYLNFTNFQLIEIVPYNYYSCDVKTIQLYSVIINPSFVCKLLNSVQPLPKHLSHLKRCKRLDLNSIQVILGPDPVIIPIFLDYPSQFYFIIIRRCKDQCSKTSS